MTPLSFIHDLRFADLPAEVAHQARRCLLDLIGVAASGRSTDLSRIVHGVAVRQMAAGSRGARLLFDGRRASAAGAAFAGASTIDSFDAHDGHALTKGHAGVVVLPSLLAVLEEEALEPDLGELLTCLAIGYEVATRAGIALHASVPDYHTSGAWNSIACAAIAARLLKLDPARTRHALGTAEYHGPRSQMMRCIDHPTMLKDGSGWGAFVGVSAAYLAQDGYTGAPAITLEAPEQVDRWGDLGSRWRILEQYFKPFPVCRWAQPAIEAAEFLIARHTLPANQIAKVEVETFAAGVRLGAAVPASTEAAQYALGFPLAAYLVRRRIGADEIGPEGLADPEIVSMVRRIALVEGAEFTDRFPAERLARVRITSRDGATYASPVTAARGNPDNPLPDAELRQKFEALMRDVEAHRKAEIAELVMSQSPGTSVESLVELLLSPLKDRGARVA